MDLSQCWFYTGSFSNGSAGSKTVQYDFGIDWGDGTPMDYYNNSQAVNSYLPVKHTYEKAGVYSMTISGQCENLYQSGGTGYKDRIVNLKDCLWGVAVPKNCTSPLKYAHASFFGCESLVYLGKGVFQNLSDCRTIPHLFDGAAIEYFYQYSLYGIPNLQNAEYAFEACKMIGVHKNLFKWSPKLNNLVHAFHRCDKLKSIPQNFFDNNPKISNLSWCFKSCTSLQSVPKTLFDNCLEINNVDYCFAGGRIGGGDLGYNKEMAITSNLPPLWDRQGEISHARYATGCVKAANYAQAVVTGWA